jgi:chaperonin GroEL
MARGDVRNVYTGDEVRQKAIQGAKKVYEAAAAAYSPTSGNVALEKSYGSYVISHDGVSIVRDIVLEDKLEDIGADLLIQASKKSNDTAGDGTTVTILLGYHIMNEANKRIAAGYNPMAIRRGIDKAAYILKDAISGLAKPVADKDLAKVATISASDPEVGKLVADTILKVGGVGISIEEYDGLGVIQDVVEGLYFEKGYAIEHFVTDKESEEAVLQNASVVVLEKRISANQDIIPILETVYKETEHKTVLIIGNISGQALETCALTNIAGKVKVCVVNPPVYGDQVLPFLEDVAIVTGGKLIPSSLPSDKVTADYLGEARKIMVTRGDTTILQGGGVQEDIDLRIDSLKTQMQSDKYSAFQKERMEKRLSKLQGKIGIIRVGGATESEIKEMKFRVEDAMHATRAAKEDGIVPGGAVTLAQLSKEMTSTTVADIAELSPDELQGFQCVIEAIAKPFIQLMTNSGEDGGYRLSQVQAAKRGYGFNVKEMTDQPIDLLSNGIIDPAKVLMSAIENACSVAGICTTLQGGILIDRQYQLEQVQITKGM